MRPDGRRLRVSFPAWRREEVVVVAGPGTVRPTLDERGLWSPFTGHSCSPGSCACSDVGFASRRAQGQRG